MSSKFCALFLLLSLTKLSRQAKNQNIILVPTTPSPSSNSEENTCSQTITSTNRRNNNVPRNCREVQNRGHNISDMYYIQPEFASEPFPVVCDMKTKGGGWTYILNRFDGSEDFYLEWDNYKEGFGNIAGEFWLGLEKIHLLTGHEFNELLIEIVDWDNKIVDAHYNTFTVGSEKEGYVLKVVEGFSGSAGDSFVIQAGMRFTTKDKDQDLWSEGNCAVTSLGAWWYRSCKLSNLAGTYFKEYQTVNDFTGMYWYTYRGDLYSHKQARMMVRPRIGGGGGLQPRDKFV